MKGPAFKARGIAVTLALAMPPALAMPSIPPALAPPGRAVAFEELPGFARDDHGAAFRVFRASCAAPVPSRPALPPLAALGRACAAALALGRDIDDRTARRFLEARFTPRLVATDAFFTGYYEPVVQGSLTRTAAYATPLYPCPPDLVTAAPGQPLPGLDPALSAARRLPDGRLEALPDRAAIDAGALDAKPLVYLRDPVEAFFVQIQGSARIELPDRSSRRLVYAGRNGYPYTAIGKVLVATLHVPPEQMGMAQLRAWIRANGQGPGGAGTRLMQRNRSYIFFRFDDSLPPGAGPIGGAGASLTALRSLAIDRRAWPYGLPFYVDAALPWTGAAPTPFRRLMIGQDTGSAIVGRARADIFFGTGDTAAGRAGAIRQHGTLFVLWPKEGDVAR